MLIQSNSTMAIMKTDLTRCLAGTFIIVIILIGVLCSVFLVDRSPAVLQLGELKQVHVIFSHGERTPTFEEVQLFPLSVNHNETYYPYGFGSLTNNGKMKMYELGFKFKEHYHEFLGDKYEPSKFIMQSVEADVSKMSALLVTAGIWPVKTDELWNIDQWQPISYKTVEQNSDFLQYEINCPRFEEERHKVTQEYMAHNDLPYTQLFDLLDLYTGSNITDISQVVKLADFIKAQRPFTNSTPKWYRNLETIIDNVIIAEKKLKYQKPSMKEISTGYLFKKIFMDGKQMIESLEDTVDKTMYCYSASTSNIAALLADTNMKHIIPKLGSAFIVELYSTVSDYYDYIYKFRYFDGDRITNIDLHRCEDPCFIHNLKYLVSKTLHKDYETECNA